MIDPDGVSYILFTVTPGFAADFDLGSVGALYDLPLPAGWAHFSCKLKVETAGIAEVYGWHPVLPGLRHRKSHVSLDR